MKHLLFVLFISLSANAGTPVPTPPKDIEINISKPACTFSPEKGEVSCKDGVDLKEVVETLVKQLIANGNACQARIAELEKKLVPPVKK